MNKTIKIGSRLIGDSCPVYIIAEMSANHGKDFDKAVEIVREAKKIGANCIKIQTYTPDTLTLRSSKDFFKIKSGTWNGENLHGLYEKAYMPWEWQSDLKKEAEKIGIDFLSTAYDKTSVDFLESINLGFYKIASFELVDIPLIKYIASKQKPIILSTGMATLGEIELAVNTIKNQGNQNLCLLKCTSEYPAKLDVMNLKTIRNLNETFGLPIGFSDHSLGSLAAVVAVAQGACVIEKHFIMSRSQGGPDSSFSMEPEEFKAMIHDIRDAESALGKISYELSECEQKNRHFRKSIFTIKDIKKGEILNENNIGIIRPSDGLEPKFLDSIIGRKAKQALEAGTPLSWYLID